MFTQSGLQFYPPQSIVSVPEQNKHSESQIAKSGVAIFQNGPITNYAEDFQTRLEVVSKLVPHHEVQRAYGEFVKKLNEMCYETVAEQLVRSNRPASVSSSVYSQNTRSIRRNVKESDNGSNSTIHRLYKAAEGVQKHLSTISESSHGEGLILPPKQSNRRNKSKIIDQVSDGVSKCKSSKKIFSTKKIRTSVEESSIETIETEFNITKDSLRNSNTVFRKERITAMRTNSSKHQKNKDSRSVVSRTKKSKTDNTEETLHQIRSNHKKTALSPFYQRLHKQRRLPHEMTPL